MNTNKLPKIEYNKTPNVLFMGNGINNCFNKISWPGLIESIGNKNSEYEKYVGTIKNMPYPLQAVVATNDRVDEAANLISEKLLEDETDSVQKALIDKYMGIPFDAILTTNYTYEIERAIDSEFECKLKRASKYRKTTFKGTKSQEQLGIFKFMDLEYRGLSRNIWHIHGEAARPSSMVLGHYYYGNLLSEIRAYTPKCITKYKGSRLHEAAFQPYSWIDYFLLGNVYIVGFGMDLSEMDIWWLINQKKRNFGECGKIRCYEPNLDDNRFERKLLAEAYGVEVHTKHVSEYLDYYMELADVIREAVTCS